MQLFYFDNLSIRRFVFPNINTWMHLLRKQLYEILSGPVIIAQRLVTWSYITSFHSCAEQVLGAWAAFLWGRQAGQGSQRQQIFLCVSAFYKYLVLNKTFSRSKGALYFSLVNYLNDRSCLVSYAHCSGGSYQDATDAAVVLFGRCRSANITWACYDICQFSVFRCYTWVCRPICPTSLCAFKLKTPKDQSEWAMNI